MCTYTVSMERRCRQASVSHSSVEACDSSVAGCKGVRQGEAPAVGRGLPPAVGRGVRGACPLRRCRQARVFDSSVKVGVWIAPCDGGAGGLPPASDRVDLLSFALSLFLSFSLYQNCNI